MGTCLHVPKRRSSAYLLLFLFVSTILFFSSNRNGNSLSSRKELTIQELDATQQTTNRQQKKHEDGTQQLTTKPPMTQNPANVNKSTEVHEEKLRLNDFMSGGGLNFYNAMLGQTLSLSFYLKDLNNNPLSPPEKEKEVCMYLIDNSPRRVDVATGYDCLLQLQMNEIASELDIFRAIKYGSLSLETFYTKAAAVNLIKAIISGYEGEVSFLGENFDNITQFCTGYRNDEENCLEEVLQLNIPGLNERVFMRQSYIHTFGRSSFNENATQIDLEQGIDKINYVRNTTKINQTNILDIVFTVSEEYAIAAATCLVSALVNSDLDSFYRFHVVVDPERLISEESQRKLASYTYIRDYLIDFIVFPLDLISNVVTENIERGSMFIAMYRLYLDLMFLDLNTVLYLDTDIIVRRDLNALKNVDMTDYIWAGAPVVMYRFDQPYINGQLPHHYINAGVLLVNLTNSRRVSIQDKIVHSILYVHECNRHEQTMINGLFADYITYLPHRWNAIVNEHTESFHFSSFIQHHIGGGKPWKGKNEEILEDNFDEAPSFRQEWSRYRELTRW